MHRNPWLWRGLLATLPLLLGAWWFFVQTPEHRPLRSTPMPAVSQSSAAASASANAQALDPSEVTVRVSAEAGPVAEVGVLLQHVAQAELFFTERTGNDGEARFVAVPRGPYRMTTMHLAFAPHSRTVSISRAKQTVTVALEKSVQADDVAATDNSPSSAQAERRVSGRVIDAAAKPVENAQVGASGSGLPRFTTSDAEGRFELSKLTGASVNLFATAPEYAPAHQHGVPVGSSSVELVMLAAAELSGELEFRERPASLYVKLCRFEPLYDKELCVKSEYYKPPRTTYRFKRAPVGNFSLVFSDGERELKRLPVQIGPGEQVQVPLQPL